MNACVNKYNKRVRIERLAGTADAHGHVNNTVNANWSTYASGFASVISQGGKEFWKVHQTQADVSHVWKMPWSKVIAMATPDMRLIYDGNTYEILSVIDIDEAHREVEIQTRRAII